MAKTIVIFFLHIVMTSFMFLRTNPISLPMIPIDSPQLQLFPQNLGTHERFQIYKNITISRAFSRKKVLNHTITNSIGTSLYHQLSNFYATKLYFGTTDKIHTSYVVLDTADDNTWIQCDGCDPCFEVKDGNVRVHDSPTYKYLTLDDPRCYPQVVYKGTCGFSSHYGSGATTKGHMGADSFQFVDYKTQQAKLYPNIAFGCGLENLDFDFGHNMGPNNLIAGIMGLGPSPQSFLTQLDDQTHGKFTYCLTSWKESTAGYSTMHFGDDAQLKDYTKRIKMNSQFGYHLYFQGISVDGKRLAIDPTLCQLSNDGQHGYFIDSGAPYSGLTQSAYDPFIAAIEYYFSRYGWTIDSSLGDDIFDICYRNTPKEGQSYPSVVFHFSDGDKGEVDWVMDNANMFVKLDNNVDGFCVVMVSIPDEAPGLCIFGAYNQADFRILYDVKNSFLFFTPERCQEYL